MRCDFQCRGPLPICLIVWQKAAVIVDRVGLGGCIFSAVLPLFEETSRTLNGPGYDKAKADLSLRWAHRSFPWLCHATAQMAEFAVRLQLHQYTVFYSFCTLCLT